MQAYDSTISQQACSCRLVLYASKLPFAVDDVLCVGTQKQSADQCYARGTLLLCICCVLSAPCGGAQYAKVIQRLGFPATFKDFKVQNIVGSTDVRFPIRLEGLSYSHGLFCSVRGPALSLCECCTGPAPAKAQGQLCAMLLPVLLTRLARTFWPVGSSPCLAVSGLVVCTCASLPRPLQPCTGILTVPAPFLLIPCLPAAQYEPELFPGLIYRMKEPKVVLLIFVSGKVVLTGARPVQPSPRAANCRVWFSRGA